MARFRFEELEIWRSSCMLGDRLDALANELEKAHKFRYAEQLRGAALSVSNNIAEGSGSESAKEFRQFLSIARRSAYENANMILMFQRRSLLSLEDADHLLEGYRALSAQISAFRKRLNT